MRRLFKYFEEWGIEGIAVKDPGLQKYITLEPRLVPHSCGRHASKQFGKARVTVVERLINKLMRSGPGVRKLRGKYIRGGKACGKKQH